MAKVRVYNAGLEQPILTHVRVYKASLSGSALVTPKVRVYKASLSGTAAVAINPLNPQTDVTPETLVTLTATLVGGGSPDSWTWRRISGPAITFTGSGATRSFYAPSYQLAGVPSATSVVVGVTATTGSTTSAERTVQIDVLPQPSWLYRAGTFVGRRPSVSISS